MPGQNPTLTTLFKAGCFEADTINALNTNLTNVNTAFTNSPGLVGTPINGSVAFGNYTTGGTSNTLLASGHAAGTYRISVFAVITTTVTTAANIGHTLGWTDDQGAHTQANQMSALTAGTTQTVVTVVRSTGAAAITLTEIAGTSNAGAGAVALSAFVERLV